MNDIEILSKLISYKTDANETSNKECNDFIASMFKANGWKVDYVNNKTSNKENIVATLGGELKNIKSGLLLSGHIDTVCTNKEAWSTNPFNLTIKDNDMYGLGVADMKYFTASILSILGEINKLNLKKPLVFALTSDEETIMQGISSVVEYFKINNISPDFCIIGEPNNKQFSNSNKGFYEFETNIYGRSCHSSSPNLGTNAIYIMSKLINYLEELSKKYFNEGTTINVGVINGGELCNIVPDNCKIRWDVRTFSRKHLKDIEKDVRLYLDNLVKQYLDASYTSEIVFQIPAFENKSNSIIEFLLNKYNFQENPYSAATEAGFFQEIGINCTIFGVGDIKDAHAINEKLYVDDYKEYQKLLLDMIKDICCD